MTVETTDYTPGGKTLDDCTPRELLLTIRAIRGHGMLREHAAERLMNRIRDELESRDMGLYTYYDHTPEERGIIHSIGEMKADGAPIEAEDHHCALLARSKDERTYRVFIVDGPLSKVRDELRAFCD